MAASSKTPPNYMKFIIGGLSGMGATLFVQPFDLLKNRMQIVPGSQFMPTLNNVIKNEGFFSLYNGLSAGLLRQATYTTTRLGVYNALFERFTDPMGLPPTFLMKALLGMSAGGIAAMVGNPTEIALVRMSADGLKPLAERRGYKNVFDAILRIAREEGVATLWRGCTPTVVRAMVVNASQLASYSQAKELLLHAGFKDGLQLHFAASMLSGLVTSVASLPVDIIKTRYQNMGKVNGVPEYTGLTHVARTIYTKEGVGAFWKGLVPYFSRLGPHTVLTFIFMEQFAQLYARLH